MPGQQDDSAHPVRPVRRDVITPYAFQVHPALLGLPLAQPWRRAVAIAIDGVLVGLLTLVPSPLLLLVIGIVMFRWAGSTPHHWAMRHRISLRACAGVLVLVGAIALAGGRRLEFGDDEPVVSAHLSEADKAKLKKEVIEAIEATPDAADMAGSVDIKPPPGRARQAASSVIGWVKGILDDLGIGLGWVALYFTVFSAWWNGQTPGKKLLGIRVVQLDGSPITLWEAFERCGGYGAGLATGLLGFIQVWWDPNRQAIHDKIAETVVIRGDLKV